jgi:hypothetical protein
VVLEGEFKNDGKKAQAKESNVGFEIQEARNQNLPWIDRHELDKDYVYDFDYDYQIPDDSQEDAEIFEGENVDDNTFQEDLSWPLTSAGVEEGGCTPQEGDGYSFITERDFDVVSISSADSDWDIG